MVAQNVAQMTAGLGVTKSRSRPKTSNDNPYSEGQYKTLKYRHDFPDRFGALEDARTWCTQFFTWYNKEHRYYGIGLHTPHDVHFGLAEQLHEMRRLPARPPGRLHVLHLRPGLPRGRAPAPWTARLHRR